MDTVPSIKQNPPPARPPPARLPDFRSLGVVLRTLLIANGVCLFAAFARQPTLSGFTSEFAAIAAAAQPIVLISIVVLWWAKPLLDRLAYRSALAAILLVELLIATGVYWFLQFLIPHWESASLLLYCLATIAIAALTLFYFDLRARALSPAITEARLQALQARIRPHFLFNSITAVLSLVREEPRRAERALEDMAELFRVLMADNRELTRLEQEVELCRQYLDLEQLRLGERLQVAWHVDKMPKDALVPPLLLQPLLENAVYHGIEPSSTPGEVNINIYRNRDQVMIVLRNPYLGDGGSHHAGNKMAMGNIRERLALHFDVEASLKTQLVGNSYQVTINLPYRPAQA